jgi:hypothetical protein
MNKSKLFKAAHAMAKKVHKVGDCYRVTFGAAVRAIVAKINGVGMAAKDIRKHVTFFSSRNLLTADERKAFVIDAADSVVLAIYRRVAADLTA